MRFAQSNSPMRVLSQALIALRVMVVHHAERDAYASEKHRQGRPAF